jgi:hypothetical protein
MIRDFKWFCKHQVVYHSTSFGCVVLYNADGCFNITIRQCSTTKIGFRVVTFNESKDDYLLTLIQSFERL